MLLLFLALSEIVGCDLLLLTREELAHALLVALVFEVNIGGLFLQVHLAFALEKHPQILDLTGVVPAIFVFADVDDEAGLRSLLNSHFATFLFRLDDETWLSDRNRVLLVEI